MTKKSNRRLEDLVQAISTYNGSKDPLHPGYQARNPLLLQVFTLDGQATGKLRTFNSFHAGLLSAVYDLEVKCSGRSRARLHGENFNLKGLMRVYNLPDLTVKYVVKFLRKSLGSQEITEDTTLDFFLEERSAQANYEIKESNA